MGWGRRSVGGSTLACCHLVAGPSGLRSSQGLLIRFQQHFSWVTKVLPNLNHGHLRGKDHCSLLSTLRTPLPHSLQVTPPGPSEVRPSHLRPPTSRRLTWPHLWAPPEHCAPAPGQRAQSLAECPRSLISFFSVALRPVPTLLCDCHCLGHLEMEEGGLDCAGFPSLYPPPPGTSVPH